MNRFRSPLHGCMSLRTHIQCWGLISLLLMVGCQDKVGAPVNLDVAQTTLSSAMEAWKNGKTPKDLLDGSPSIFVQEAEWNEGMKLLDYEIISDDQPVGPNLVATVKLKISKPDGNVAQKTATYIVSTSPSLTVYRNTMK